MPSEFDEFMSDGLDFMSEKVGTIVFSIDGVEYQADLDQSVIERGELEGGGTAVIRSARLVVKKSQFDVPPAYGKRVTLDGEDLRLKVIAKDSVSYTLTLVEVDK